MDDDFMAGLEAYQVRGVDIVEASDDEVVEVPAAPAGNPMQRLESLSITQQVDSLLARLLGGDSAYDAGDQSGLQQDEEGGGGGGGSGESEAAALANSTEEREVRRLDNMIHEVVVPRGAPLPPLRATNAAPALHFPFPLDPFQHEAIQVVENGRSLLVAAHTSAGKTAIARYAMAEGLRNGKCVIYTSPIKALSNQKYRELEEEFGESVGIATGDVTINQRAPLQVMTTEILRSMLYKKPEFFSSSVAWVVFDEVHYMNDAERGVVWEEAIILLPSSIRLLFLSATVPNAKQFAGWVCKIKRTPVHVISTERRPVPLAHYLLPVGSSGLFEIVNAAGALREDKLAEAMHEMEKGGEKERREKKRSRDIKDSTLISLTRTLAERDLLSCVAFAFSRAECEHYAAAIKDLDMNDEDEKSTVRGLFANAIDLLSDEDKKLSQIENLRPLLERGIGVHHSGLLPVLKETIELLFAEGLIKMLFATETFAMGVNVPARSVVFTSARKYDGQSSRWLSASEYAQMSGRAGRRNSSLHGVSILMLDERVKGSELRAIVKGDLAPLRSQFRLSYHLLLQLLQARVMQPSDLMEASLLSYQNTMEIPELSAKIREHEAALAAISIPPDQRESAEKFMQLETAIKRIRVTTKKMYLTLAHLIPFLNPGRLIKIKHGSLDFGWGALCNFSRKEDPDDRQSYHYILDVLVNADAASTRDFNATGALKPAGSEGKSSWEVVPMAVGCVDEIGAARFFLPQDVTRSAERREETGKLIEHFVRERMAGEPALLDPVADMKLNTPALKEAMAKAREFEKRLANHPLTTMKKGGERERAQFEQITRAHREKAEMEAELKQLRAELRRKRTDIRTGTELFRRKQLLLKLGYIDDDDALIRKGEIAACISTGDELMLTELMMGRDLEGVEGDANLAALLSCFVCDERSGSGKLSRELTEHHKLVQKYARKVAGLVIKTGQTLDETEYVDRFKPAMMEVTRAWVRGEKAFAALLKTTHLYEGSIIRCLRRLEELLKELSTAAGVAGKSTLQNRFDDIRTAIKRDIVFATSLYL